jgi:hypothetical protein
VSDSPKPGEPTGAPGRRRGFWARFAHQETGPQKVIVGLAGTVTAVATTIGGVYGVVHLLKDDTSSAASSPTSVVPSDSAGLAEPEVSMTPSTGASSTTSPADPPPVTTRPGQTLVTQGSAEADALVRSFVEPAGGRIPLDVVLISERAFPQPQWIMRLWYNCHDLPAGQPPGEDLCDSVMLVFDDASPSPTRFDNPRRIELRGLWADNRPSGLGYGAKGLEIFPVQAAE